MGSAIEACYDVQYVVCSLVYFSCTQVKFLCFFVDKWMDKFIITIINKHGLCMQTTEALWDYT